MKYLSRLRRPIDYKSKLWVESKHLSGVRFAIKTVSLGERIQLAERVRDLLQKNEFLRAGDALEQNEANLADLFVRVLYLEWGLIAVEGLKIDGKYASVKDIVEKGPEALSNEIIASIKAQLELTEAEAKNS